MYCIFSGVFGLPYRLASLLTLIAAGSKTDGLVSGLAQTSTPFFSAYEHRRISIEVYFLVTVLFFISAKKDRKILRLLRQEFTVCEKSVT